MKAYSATLWYCNGDIRKTASFVNPHEQDVPAYFFRGSRWDQETATIKVFACNYLRALKLAKTVFKHHTWTPAFEYGVMTDNGHKLYISYILTEQEAKAFDSKLWYEQKAELHLYPLD